MRNLFLLICCFTAMSINTCTIQASGQLIWKIGIADGSGNELALAPDKYKQFLANDFGYEDRFFLIGKSKEKESFPYILPGPADESGFGLPFAH